MDGEEEIDRRQAVERGIKRERNNKTYRERKIIFICGSKVIMDSFRIRIMSH